MKSNQFAIIKGRVVGDAELKTASSGKNYMRIRVAVNEKVGSKKEEVTTFYNVVCFDKMAEIFSKLKKGDYIRTEGRLELDVYKDKSDEPKVDATVIAEEIMKSDYLVDEKIKGAKSK